MLGKILGMLLRLLGLGQRSAITKLVLDYLTGGSGKSAGGTAGGLGGLLEKFKQAGLGKTADSWVGTGKNEPVSPEQVKEVVGRDQLSEMAAKLGIPVDQVAGKLLKYLPGIIDKLTPGGKLPGA